MKLKKFGFLRHHKKIKIEGTDQSKIINKCINNNILLKDFTWQDPLESTAFIKDEDYENLKKASGNSYRFTVLKEGGAVPFLKKLKAGKLSVAGAFLMGALIFYQGLFVAEIQVSGYKAIPEEDLRQTMEQAGLYEGARKMKDYSLVKADLYKNHDKITWVSIYEKGRLVKVSIAEADNEEYRKGNKNVYEEIPDNIPVNIVATKAGFVETIQPLQGDALVQKGDYVNKGDILISGDYQYQSTDYSKGDGFFSMYSHADGEVLARTPRLIEFYMQKAERTLQPTGKFMPGIFIKIGDMKIDPAGNWHRYEVAQRKETELIDIVKPLPFKICLVKISQVEIMEEPISQRKIDKRIEAVLRQYEKREFDINEGIITKSIEFEETENLIKVSVFAEVMEDIGTEKKIQVKNKEKDKEKTNQ